MTLGDIIKEYRLSQGLSQDAIAERANLSKAYISILERNRNPKTNEPPIASLKTINAIAKAINSDFDTIFAKLDADLKVSIGEQLPDGALTAANTQFNQISEEEDNSENSVFSLSPTESRLVKCYRIASPEDRQIIDNIVNRYTHEFKGQNLA